MFSRIQIFAEPLLVMATIAVLYQFFFRFVSARVLKTKLESISWLAKNRLSLGISAAIVLYVGAPVTEELVFRAPLVILFDKLSPTAWVAIVLMSIGFAALHLKNPPTWAAVKLLEKHKRGELESDRTQTELERIKSEGPSSSEEKEERIKRIGQVIYTFLIGIVAGYLGIGHQSLWLPVATHFVANLLGPIILVLLLAIGLAFVHLLLPVWDRIDAVLWKRKLRQIKSKYYRW